MVNLRSFTTAIALGTTVAAAPAAKDKVVNETTCNGNTYKYKELAGYGFVKPDATDKFGDTLGGIGSSLAIEKGSWNKKGKKYEATFWALPDRGWNTQGTLNYQNRVHKFKIKFAPEKSGKANLEFEYKDSVLFSGPDGQPTTGLDADAVGSLQYPGFPNLPAATYPGDGYGGEGPGGKRVSFDAEGLVLGDDGTFWVSDEYGAYIYKFDKKGKMTAAIRPPDAFIPLRNGTESFNSDTPPFYDQQRVVIPADPESGRNNNQGFEGLTISADGKTLTVLTQSALMQEGGTSNKDRFNARLLQYDISGKTPNYLAEYVVPLPRFTNNEGKQRVAAQSEILQVSKTQYLVLARDGEGRGADFSESLYRRADIFDLSKATNIKGPDADKTGGAIADKDGNLKSGITAATYCSWLDFNVNSELAKFGLQNGGAQDDTLLAEKWESLALAPVDGKKGDDGEFFLFSFADNDFITTNGKLNFGKYPYSDDLDINSQALVFKVQLPKGTKIRGF